MSDLETRLRAALDAVAAKAPSASGLAHAARDQARVRRRGRVGVAVAAAVLAIVVPALVGLGLRGDGGDRAVQVPVPTRVESWHNATLRVPADWGYGTLATWCLAGRGSTPPPLVERPGGAAEGIGCLQPQSWYGVQFLPVDKVDPPVPVSQYHWGVGPASRYPDGAWVGDVAAGHIGVRVIARDESTARRILGSVTLIDGLDGNGCAPRIDAPETAANERLSVCRYGPDGWLEQSELLSSSDTALASQALETATPITQGGGCPSTPDRFPVVVLHSLVVDARVVWGADCAAARRLTLNGASHALTSEVMFWALSPGFSGGFDGSVPVPDRWRVAGAS
jgi:hypothetical protein